MIWLFATHGAFPQFISISELRKLGNILLYSIRSFPAAVEKTFLYLLKIISILINFFRSLNCNTFLYFLVFFKIPFPQILSTSFSNYHNEVCFQRLFIIWFQIFWRWVYLLKFILQMDRTKYIWYLGFY
jgi:hypothetical protein